MLQSIVLVVHLLVALLIVVFVLLQRGKGAEAGTGFGAGASGTVFGARGTSSFFSRVTAILATLFFATSLGLAYFSTRGSAPKSVLQGSVLKGGHSEQSGAAAGAKPSKKTEAPAQGAQAPAAKAPASHSSQPPAIEPPPAGQPPGGTADSGAPKN